MSKVIATIKKGAKGKGPNVTFKAEGIPGGDCRVISKPYLETVGGSVINDQATDEANQIATVSVDNHVNA